MSRSNESRGQLAISLLTPWGVESGQWDAPPNRIASPGPEFSWTTFGQQTIPVFRDLALVRQFFHQHTGIVGCSIPLPVRPDLDALTDEQRAAALEGSSAEVDLWELVGNGVYLLDGPGVRRASYNSIELYPRMILGQRRHASEITSAACRLSVHGTGEIVLIFASPNLVQAV